MASHFKINGIQVKNPSTFKIERYNVTTMERLANADMVGDLVAKKLKFYFTYDAITAADLDKILDAIWNTETLFYTLQYEENGVVKSSVVYSGSIPSELYFGGNRGNWVWQNVSFNLIAR